MGTDSRQPTVVGVLNPSCSLDQSYEYAFDMLVQRTVTRLYTHRATTNRQDAADIVTAQR